MSDRDDQGDSWTTPADRAPDGASEDGNGPSDGTSEREARPGEAAGDEDEGSGAPPSDEALSWILSIPIFAAIVVAAILAVSVLGGADLTDDLPFSREFGDPCSDPNQCWTMVCVTFEKSTFSSSPLHGVGDGFSIPKTVGRCTRICSGSEDCGPGADCDTVSGKDVCVEDELD